MPPATGLVGARGEKRKQTLSSKERLVNMLRGMGWGGEDVYGNAANSGIDAIKDDARNYFRAWQSAIKP